MADLKHERVDSGSKMTDFGSEWADLGFERGRLGLRKPGGDVRMDGWMDGRTDRHLEIPPCFLQYIGLKGPLLKKERR